MTHIPIVKVSNLDKYFGRLHVLKSINLEVAEREVVVVIGRSGSGKSTLLRCINFLEEPDHGSIEVDSVVVPASRGANSCRYFRTLRSLANRRR